MKIYKLTQEIKKAIEDLIAIDIGCYTIKLDNNLAICIGWSDGFDPNDNTIIHSKIKPTFGLVVGIKVYTSDDLRIDYDWINYPYLENQEVITIEQTISIEEDYESLIKFLIEEYNNLTNSYKVITKYGSLKKIN